MEATSTINVTLPREYEKFIRDQVATGQHQSESEVLLDGLLLLEQQERESDADFLALKAKLQRASEQADRGEFITPKQSRQQIVELKRLRALRKS